MLAHLQGGVASVALQPPGLRPRKNPEAKILVIGQASSPRNSRAVFAESLETITSVTDKVVSVVTVIKDGYIVGPFNLLSQMHKLPHPVYVKDANRVGKGDTCVDLRPAFRSVVPIPGSSGLAVTQVKTDLEPSFSRELCRISIQAAMWNRDSPFFARSVTGYLAENNTVHTEDGVSGMNASMFGAARFHHDELDGVMGQDGHWVFTESILACLPAND